jgi:hypothetical protein
MEWCVDSVSATRVRREAHTNTMPPRAWHCSNCGRRQCLAPLPANLGAAWPTQRHGTWRNSSGRLPSSVPGSLPGGARSVRSAVQATTARAARPMRKWTIGHTACRGRARANPSREPRAASGVPTCGHASCVAPSRALRRCRTALCGRRSPKLSTHSDSDEERLRHNRLTLDARRRESDDP